MSRTNVGITMAAVGAAIFGVSATLVGSIIEDVDPFRLSTLRIAVAGFCLLPWAIAYRSAIRRAPVRVALVGVLQIVNGGFLFTAIARIGVGPAVGLAFLAPVFVMLWDQVVGHAHPRPVTWVAVIAAVVGVGLLVQIGDVGTLDIVGVFAGFGSAVLFAIYLRMSEHVGAIVGGFPLAAGAIAMGGVVGIIIARPWSMPMPYDTNVIWTVLILGTFAMALPLSLEIASLSRVPARIVGVIVAVDPVAASVTAWIFLDESLGASQILGLILIVAAVAAVSLLISSSRQEPTVAS